MTRSQAHAKLPGAFPKPTAQVEPFVDALGFEDALRFLDAFGGTEVYIPKNPKGRGEVEKLLGREKAKMLAGQMHRIPARIPTAKAWRARAHRSKGLPVVEIARILGVTDFSVRRYLRWVTPPSDPDQPGLF
ncbi:helix-turn-helix domain-containing protein [Phaeobacter sp. B1627]|uniref:helix-turn-helix domain-containing protein n=1 Tax=Phaeobacter sp. B1627 TaxID=2583809 RepID=UPI0011192B7B|nr:helix-turn-helix domain-containing protein [Phaeobacter sp. B1627]TNJ40478.1 helix-turn-helix domain-containing protein [Phaeobacter sp. B1627]